MRGLEPVCLNYIGIAEAYFVCRQRNGDGEDKKTPPVSLFFQAEHQWKILCQKNHWRRVYYTRRSNP